MKIILIKKHLTSFVCVFFLEQYEHRFSNKVKNNFMYTKAFWHMEHNNNRHQGFPVLVNNELKEKTHPLTLCPHYSYVCM